MAPWKRVPRMAVILPVGVLLFASVLTGGARERIGRDLQEIDSWMSEGTRLCQYAVEDEDEALAKGGDPSVPGTTINLTSVEYGRLGNRFTSVSRFLSLGYCCKAKLVTLPPQDSSLAPGMFGEGDLGPRHFDFSGAPDVLGFNSSASCAADYTMRDKDAYRSFLPQGGLPYGSMREMELALCVRSVRVLDCEAAYYFPKSLDLCGALDGSTEPDLIEDKVAAKNSITSESHEERGGNLVIHVRSGDVFRRKKAYRSYGQPPLSYYMGVINSRDWDRVDIVTYGPDQRDENPVLPALRMLAAMGTWPNTDLNIHEDRSIEVDLQAMLCANALATSRSTLGELTMYHTRATSIFLSSTCDGYGSVFGHTAGRLLSARSSRDESFQVHGVKLTSEAPRYTLYEIDTFTDIERLEMLEYPGLAGIEECTSLELDADRWDSVSSSRSPLGNVRR